MRTAPDKMNDIMKRSLWLCASALALCACQDAAEDDGVDDSFVSDGKEDTGGVREGSAPALAVLQLVNEADLAGLKLAQLTTTTAQNIVTHRAGSDGQLGTADDDPYGTLAELDAVPYVGAVAFQKLLERATELGYITFDWKTHLAWPAWSDSKPTLCTIRGPADAKELRLMFDVKQGASWRIDVRDSDGTMVQTILPPFSGWSNAIRGNVATYQIYGSGAYWNCKDFRGLSQAFAASEPVAISDPMRCTSTATLGTVTPSDAMMGKLGFFNVPNTNLFSTFGKAFTSSCGNMGVAVAYTPPTDGLYTFSSYANRWLAVRVAGCAGIEAGCGATSTTVKLFKNVPVVLGIDAHVQDGSIVYAARSKVEVSCNDGFDDNGDNLVDCADPTCAFQCHIPEVCNNDVDDDSDGKLDCFDSECNTSALCSVNQCPGEDLGSATSPTAPVAAGNASQAPSQTFLSCGSNALPWQASRFYEWHAPTAGTYSFRLADSFLYDGGIKLLDGTCDGDALACDVQSNGGGIGVARAMTAGQAVVIEVGMSRHVTDSSAFTLSIRKQ
jgi:hypothetical protein